MSDEKKYSGWVREDILKEQAEADAKKPKAANEPEKKAANKEKKP
jgi:hypothetical protein